MKARKLNKKAAELAAWLEETTPRYIVPALESMVVAAKLTLASLVKGQSYTREDLAPLFARNDSSLSKCAGNLDLDRDKRVMLPLYKCGEFAGVRRWFVPTINGFMYCGETMQIDGNWYSDKSGTAHKTRDNVLRESIRKYMLS